MKTIFKKMIQELKQKNNLMLVTIIAEQGTTPRGTGSQMLVGAKGQLAGTIGGGAVEKSAELYAMELMKDGRSELHEFHLHNDQDGNLDMACGGDVTVLFYYIDGHDGCWKNIAENALERIASKKAGWLVQGINGTKAALLNENGESLVGELDEKNDELMKKTSILSGNCFSMPLPIGERAIIFGGGHCGLALAPVLKSIGFRVVVFDDREEYANWERFPDAEQVICGDYMHLADYITLTEDDYAIVMTTGHRHDFEVEEQALRGPLAYIGAMGSPAKTESVNKRLLEQGISEEDLKRVYTPIGLNIKGSTPEEIAISIAAEMILVRSTRLEAEGNLKFSCPVK